MTGDEATAAGGTRRSPVRRRHGARRRLLPPGDSEHVKGGAVDVSPRVAATWLETHGVRFGLCRRYVNEWWHVERLAGPAGARCPRLQTDAAG